MKQRNGTQIQIVTNKRRKSVPVVSSIAAKEINELKNQMVKDKQSNSQSQWSHPSLAKRRRKKKERRSLKARWSKTDSLTVSSCGLIHRWQRKKKKKGGKKELKNQVVKDKQSNSPCGPCGLIHRRQRKKKKSLKARWLKTNSLTVWSHPAKKEKNEIKNQMVKDKQSNSRSLWSHPSLAKKERKGEKKERERERERKKTPDGHGHLSLLSSSGTQVVFFFLSFMKQPIVPYKSEPSARYSRSLI